MQDIEKAFAFALVFAFFLAVGTNFHFSLPQQPEKVVYQTVHEFVNNTVEVPVWNIPEQSLIAYGIGVFENSSQGELIGIQLTLRGGNGSILLDVEDKAFGPDFQETLPLIKTYAEKFAQVKLGLRDLIVQAHATAVTISGASGSTVIATGLIALLENKTLKKDTIITGVLMPDGTIGSVNALKQKILAAAANGVTEILIPQDQCEEGNTTANITVTCVADMKSAAPKLMT